MGLSVVVNETNAPRAVRCLFITWRYAQSGPYIPVAGEANRPSKPSQTRSESTSVAAALNFIYFKPTWRSCLEWTSAPSETGNRASTSQMRASFRESSSGLGTIRDS